MKAAKQTGFTLVEAMVSIFVLAAGIVGTMGLQLATLRTSQQTALQTMAVHLASEIADVFRSYGSRRHHLDEWNSFLPIDSSAGVDSAPAIAASCHAESCDAHEVMRMEIRQWTRRVRTALPDGRIRICRDTHPWDASTGAFRWQCTAAAENKTAPLAIKIGWNGRGWHADGSKATNVHSSYPPAIVMTVILDLP